MNPMEKILLETGSSHTEVLKTLAVHKECGSTSESQNDGENMETGRNSACDDRQLETDTSVPLLAEKQENGLQNNKSSNDTALKMKSLKSYDLQSKLTEFNINNEKEEETSLKPHDTTTKKKQPISDEESKKLTSNESSIELNINGDVVVFEYNQESEESHDGGKNFDDRIKSPRYSQKENANLEANGEYEENDQNTDLPKQQNNNFLKETFNNGSYSLSKEEHLHSENLNNARMHIMQKYKNLSNQNCDNSTLAPPPADISTKLREQLHLLRTRRKHRSQDPIDCSAKIFTKKLKTNIDESENKVDCNNKGDNEEPKVLLSDEFNVFTITSLISHYESPSSEIDSNNECDDSTKKGEDGISDSITPIKTTDVTKPKEGLHYLEVRNATCGKEAKVDDFGKSSTTSNKNNGISDSITPTNTKEDDFPKSFTISNENNANKRISDSIIPTKTTDITKIKGWKKKNFILHKKEINNVSQLLSDSETSNQSKPSALDKESPLCSEISDLCGNFESPYTINDKTQPAFNISYQISNFQCCNEMYMDIKFPQGNGANLQTVRDPTQTGINDNTEAQEFVDNMCVKQTDVLKIRERLIEKNLPFTRRCFVVSTEITNTNAYVTYNGRKIKVPSSSRKHNLMEINEKRKCRRTNNNYCVKYCKDIRSKFLGTPKQKKLSLLDQLKINASKSFYNSLNWKTTKLKLPKLTLDVVPLIGKPMDPRIRHLIQNSDDITLTEDRTEFALSALITNNDNLRKKKVFSFPIPYQYNQTHVNVIKQRPTNPLSEKAKVIESDDEIAKSVHDIMDQMLNYIDIKEDTQDVIKNPDINESSSQLQTYHSNAHKRCRTLMNGAKSVQKTAREMKRLNCKIVIVDAEDDKSETCKKDFCQLGCICKSLECNPVNIITTHCGLPKCIFGCNCNNKDRNVMNSLFTGRADLFSERVMNKLQDEAKKNLAKVEKEFTQTLIKTNDQIIMVGDTKGRKRRIIKAPKKFNDFIENVDINIFLEKEEKKPIENNIIDGTYKTLSVNLIKYNFNDIIPFCWVHELYQCYCKNQSIDTESNNNYNNAVGEFSDIDIPKDIKSNKRRISKKYKGNGKGTARTRGVSTSYYCIRHKALTFKKHLWSSAQKFHNALNRNINTSPPDTPEKAVEDKPEFFMDSKTQQCTTNRQLELKSGKSENLLKINNQSISRLTTNIDSPTQPVPNLGDVIKPRNESLQNDPNRRSRSLRSRSKSLSSYTTINDFPTQPVPNLGDVIKPRNESLPNDPNTRLRSLRSRSKSLSSYTTINDFPTQSMPSVGDVVKPRNELLPNDPITGLKLRRSKSMSRLTTNIDSPTQPMLILGDQKNSFLPNNSNNGLEINNDCPIQSMSNLRDVIKSKDEFHSLLTKKNAILRLMSWSELSTGYDSGKYILWYINNVKSCPIIITENGARRPSSRHYNINLFKSITDTKMIPDIVQWLLNKSPPLNKPIQSLYVVLSFKKPHWEIIGLFENLEKDKKKISLSLIKRWKSPTFVPNENEIPMFNLDDGSNESSQESSKKQCNNEKSANNTKQPVNKSKIMMVSTKKEFQIRKLISEDTNDIIKACQFIWAPLPIISNEFRWRVINLTTGCTHISFTYFNFTIKLEDITNAIKTATRNKMTIVLQSNQLLKHYVHRQFGVYCVHNYSDKIFIGPYSLNEDHDIKGIFRNMNSVMINTTIREKPLIGNWFRSAEVTDDDVIIVQNKRPAVIDLTLDSDDESRDDKRNEFEKETINMPEHLSIDKTLVQIENEKVKHIEFIERLNDLKSSQTPILDNVLLVACNNTDGSEILFIDQNMLENDTINISDSENTADIVDIKDTLIEKFSQVENYVKDMDCLRYLVPNASKVGYILAYKHKDSDVTEVMCPITKMIKRFDNPETAVDYSQNVLQKRFIVVPSFKIQVKLLDRPDKLNNFPLQCDDHLNGYHVLGGFGTANIQYTPENHLKHLGLTEVEIAYVISERSKKFFWDHVYELGTLFSIPVNETNREASLETILNRTVIEVRNLEMEKILYQKQKDDLKTKKVALMEQYVKLQSDLPLGQQGKAQDQMNEIIHFGAKPQTLTHTSTRETVNDSPTKQKSNAINNLKLVRSSSIKNLQQINSINLPTRQIKNVFSLNRNTATIKNSLLAQKREERSLVNNFPIKVKKQTFGKIRLQQIQSSSVHQTINMQKNTIQPSDPPYTIVGKVSLPSQTHTVLSRLNTTLTDPSTPIVCILPTPSTYTTESLKTSMATITPVPANFLNATTSSASVSKPILLKSNPLTKSISNITYQESVNNVKYYRIISNNDNSSSLVKTVQAVKRPASSVLIQPPAKKATTSVNVVDLTEKTDM